MGKRKAQKADPKGIHILDVNGMWSRNAVTDASVRSSLVLVIEWLVTSVLKSDPSLKEHTGKI